MRGYGWVLGIALGLVLVGCADSGELPYDDGIDHSWEGEVDAVIKPLANGVNYLSELSWVSASNGWGPVERDKSNGGTASGDGRTLTLNGKQYARGLGVHANGRINYNLGGQCSNLTAEVGIDDEVSSGNTYASAVFQVFADGTKIFDSGVMRPTSTTKVISLNISGKNQIGLVVTDGGINRNWYDHADWADAKVSCTVSTAPPPPPGPPAPPPASQVLTNGTYFIANQSNKLCLDVYAGQTTNGAAINQYTCHSGDNQKWNFEHLGNDIYKITAVHSGKAMEVSGISTVTGAKVQQWNYLNATNQKWKLNKYGDVYELIATHSNQCLDVPAGSTAIEVQLTQYTCHGGANQRFGITTSAPVSPPPPGPPAPPPPGPPAPPPPPAPGDVATKGQWSSKINFPLIPVAAANLPDGKLLVWSSWDRYDFSSGSGERNKTYSAIYDPSNNSISEFLVSSTNHDMFCPGTTLLADGRVFVNGGGPTVPTTSIYDSSSNSWTKDTNMVQSRWYNSTTTLPNGNVFTLGGNRTSGLSGVGEVWAQGSGWAIRSGAVMDPIITTDPNNRSQEHPRLLVAPDGRVFVPGPTPNMTWYNLSGSGSYQSAGRRGDDIFSQNDITVMFDVGKILKAGGNPNYDGTNSTTSPSTTSAYIIDINNGASVRKIAPMKHARNFASGVVLPDGQVLAVGGLNNGKTFSDSGAILPAEMFNPVSETWTELASMQTPRTYHSVAILLPDGRVFAGGGGLCGSCSVNHADAEIYSPPYLFKGARPTITGSPTQVSYGSSFQVQTTGSVNRFSIVRLSSITHSTNNDQRFMWLSSSGSGTFTVQAPVNANIAPPGYYMLFALDANGVPSVAKMIRIN